MLARLRGCAPRRHAREWGRQAPMEAANSYVSMCIPMCSCMSLGIGSTCGLVAMTSASHAEGRQFDPGQVYFFLRGARPRKNPSQWPCRAHAHATCAAQVCRRSAALGGDRRAQGCTVQQNDAEGSPMLLDSVSRAARSHCRVRCFFDDEFHLYTTPRAPVAQWCARGSYESWAPAGDVVPWSAKARLSATTDADTIATSYARGAACGRNDMTTPGVEPGLSRPQRDVLTTRRCGRRSSCTVQQTLQKHRDARRDKARKRGTVACAGHGGEAARQPCMMCMRASVIPLAEHALRRRMVVGSMPTGGSVLPVRPARDG